MATPAQRMIQDQNLNFLFSGATPAGKTDIAKADKKGGGLGGRKALNDISNSTKPSAFPSVKKESSINVISIDEDPSAVKGRSSKAPEKGKVGGRKALRDLTNSVKPRPKQVPSLGRKLNVVGEEAEERFLHNHHECIKAQTMIVDKDYFLKTVGLAKNADQNALPSARKALALSSKKVENYMKDLVVEHVFDQAEFRGCFSPACKSPQSPKAPSYMMSCWEDDSFSDLVVIESPKLK